MRKRVPSPFLGGVASAVPALEGTLKTAPSPFFPMTSTCGSRPTAKPMATRPSGSSASVRPVVLLMPLDQLFCERILHAGGAPMGGAGAADAAALASAEALAAAEAAAL